MKVVNISGMRESAGPGTDPSRNPARTLSYHFWLANPCRENDDKPTPTLRGVLTPFPRVTLEIITIAIVAIMTVRIRATALRVTFLLDLSSAIISLACKNNENKKE